MRMGNRAVEVVHGRHIALAGTSGLIRLTDLAPATVTSDWNGIWVETTLPGLRLGLGIDLLKAILPSFVAISVFRELPGELRSAALEIALEPLLTYAEEACGERVSVTAIRGPHDTAPMVAEESRQTYTWKFHVVSTEENNLLGIGRFLAGPEALEVLDRLLRPLKPTVKARFRDLPAALAVETARMQITVTELRGLQPGDVICPGIAHNTDQVWIRVPGGPRIPGRLREDHVIVEGGWMQEDNENERNETDMLQVDELPVDMTFELGRLTIPLSRLESVDQGYTFTLGGLSRSDVIIRANGRCIGRGELVQVGEEMGVRITNLHGHDVS